MRRLFKQIGTFMEWAMETPGWVLDLIKVRLKEAEEQGRRLPGSVWAAWRRASRATAASLRRSHRYRARRRSGTRRTVAWTSRPAVTSTTTQRTTAATTTRVARSTCRHGSRTLTVAGRDPSCASGASARRASRRTSRTRAIPATGAARRAIPSTATPTRTRRG